MAVDEVLVLTGEGNVDVQIGGPGQSAFKYLSACASMGGPSVPREGTELRRCQDPTRSGKFVVSTKVKTPADQASGDLMTKLSKTRHLKNLDCPFTLRARFNKCGSREDPTVYDPLMLCFCDVDITSVDYADLVSTDGNSDEIAVTTPWTASYAYEIYKITGSRLGSAADLGDQPLNDVAICDAPQCAGYCGSRKDGCSQIYAVSDKDAAPYAWPNLVTGVKNVLTDVITWTTRPIIGIDGNVEAVECGKGDRVIVSSNGASLVGYNDTIDDNGVPDQDEWNLVAMTYAPAANPNALFARTPLEIWVATDDGYVGKSLDSGETWSYVSVNTTGLDCVWAYDAELVYCAGTNGAVYRSTDGGTSWTDVSEVATFATDVLWIGVPPGRINEVYVGDNAGAVFKSTNKGATWAQMTFTGDDVGSVPSAAFCGPCGGDVLFMVHNDAGPRGRILRDLSGGHGGADVYVEAGYTSVVSAGVQLNAVVCCDENTAYAVGEVSGGYPAFFKIS